MECSLNVHHLLLCNSNVSFPINVMLSQNDTRAKMIHSAIIHHHTLPHTLAINTHTPLQFSVQVHKIQVTNCSCGVRSAVKKQNKNV